MFSQGSRYRNLPESSPVDAAGERLHGKDVRRIPPTTASFQHLAREGDRLDLLAFNYYGDPTKWWQISDANPETPFPTDLLDSQPLVVERFALAHSSFADRFHELIGALESMIEKLNGSAQFLPLESLEGWSAGQLEELYKNLAVLYGQPNFLQSTIVIIYPPSLSTRDSFLELILKKGFHLLRADEWSAADNIIEAFNLDDADVRQSWQAMVEDLSRTRGIVRLASSIMEGTLDAVYNSAIVQREVIFKLVTDRGFQFQSQKFSRVGTNVRIPPNQIV